jgi:AhpD family alkylhydroperoxidase
MDIRPAHSSADIAAVRELFLEYARALDFAFCFQDFERELAGLPGDYAPPGGCLLLAEEGGAAVGCAALRALAEGVGEMKRMYLRPALRGAGHGRRLAEALIAAARQQGCRRLRLETMPGMTAAIPLYRSLGFVPIAPYRDPAAPGALHLELRLEDPLPAGATGGCRAAGGNRLKRDKLDELTRTRKWAHMKLLALSPKVYQAFTRMEEATYAEGHLPRRTKELIAVGISVQMNCESCMQWHIEQAAAAGASLREVMEAVEVGMEMGGGPATVSARFALQVLESVFGELT